MPITALRTPDSRFENLPNWPYWPKYMSALSGYEDLRLHYVDEGPKDAEVTFLCLHGEPSWGYLYRKMAPVFLEGGHRVVIPDLFGFGRSDKPVDDEIYTYHFHRNALLAFVGELNLRNVCLVVQDWGGVLGLTLPLDEPERYTRLIIMNTDLPGGEVAPPGFAGWRAYNRANPDLKVGDLIRRGTPEMTDAEMAAYDAPFPDQSYKGGVRRFPELVMLKDPEAEALTFEASEGVETSLRARGFWKEEWQGDSFMAIGLQDPVFSKEAMEAVRRMIRGCPEAMDVEEGGHFVQEWGDLIAERALAQFGL